jgi:hypothetical protein
LPGADRCELVCAEVVEQERVGYQKMISTSAAGRVGTTDEVAAAAAYLLGPTPGSSPGPTCSSTVA